MKTAFKEWAIVVAALGRGEQIIILRKGGVQEGSAGFRVDHEKFLLFPTLYHQQREGVIASAQQRYDETAGRWASNGEFVLVEYAAAVTTWCEIKSEKQILGLRGQHIWKDEVIAERCTFGKNKGLHLLMVRVLKLSHPARLPIKADYRGCKSWVALDAEVNVEGATPVLSDSAFAQKVGDIDHALCF